MSIFDERWDITRHEAFTQEPHVGVMLPGGPVVWIPAESHRQDAFARRKQRAALIAAAPDLVAALRLARRFIPDAYEADLTIVDAALSKAGAL
jgi:hypothetical protein